MIHSYHTSNAANLLDQTQKIAIVGATGSVGQIMLEVLNEFGFTADQVIPLASKNSAGLWLPFGDEVVKVEDLEMFDFTRASFCLFSAGGHVSSLYAPKAVAAGAIVIDNTSHFRMDPLVPLIVPEVNPTSLCGVVPPIIANPNCALAQIAVALKPLHDLVPLKRITVATYQSVSGAGKKAMNELTTQTQEVLNGKTPEPVFFKKPIAFNIIPQIGCLLDNGYTDEEWKIREELQKILDPMIEVSAMCVRVPIFIGHSCAIHAQFHGPITAEEALIALRKAPGIVVTEDGKHPATPLECAGTNPVYIGRIHVDVSVAHGLCLWIVSDNLRKGAALNAVQILIMLLKIQNSL